MSKHHVSATINGEPTEFLCETQQTLLDVLRDEIGLTGSKEGCASGDCGACSVIMDGRLVCSCLVLGVRGRGHRDHHDRGHRPGRPPASGAAEVPRTRSAAMRLLHPGPHRRHQGAARREPQPDRGGSALLAGRQPVPLHRLRQGHPRRAWTRPQKCEGRRLHELRIASDLKVVGTRPIRPDGVDKVTGRAQFGADMKMAGMLWGKVHALAARACQHRLDRHQQGGEAARREGGGDRARTSPTSRRRRRSSARAR